MTSLSYPNTLEDVVGLIKRLYQPGPPIELAKTQEVLQDVQRSPDGWKLADALLGIPDQNVQFFGALTFTVKLNSDWESVSEEDIPVLRDRLINWLVTLTYENPSQLVIKKLSATLVTFFIRFPQTWPDCMRHLICSLSVGRVVPQDKLEKLPPSDQLLRKTSVKGKITALWFSAILVEEVGKVDAKNIKNHHFHDRMYNNTEDAVALLKDAMEMKDRFVSMDQNEFEPRLVEEGLKAFQSWVFYSLRALLDSTLTFPALKTLTQTAINWIADPKMFETTCEFATDILTHYFAFLTPADVSCLSNIIMSPWAQERYELLISGEGDWESLQFGRLIVAFAEATAQQIAKEPNVPQSQTLMRLLHGMITMPGYPMAEEEISGTTFEFWSSLAEFLLDSECMKHDTEGIWMMAGKKEILQAIEGFWRKIRIPANHEATTWSKDQRDGFMSFRKDVADLVEVAYSLLGVELFTRLATQILGALSQNVAGGKVPWEEIEASLFCLNSLSDSLSDEPEEDKILETLFGSELFILLADTKSDIPLKAKQTAVNIIGSYASFFERHPVYLPAVLNFLFISISTPTIARNASKSISSLCSSCRSTLVGELGTFLYQYEVFSASPKADDIAKERVLCAISYVVQALPTEEEKLEPVRKLLGFVESDIQACMSSLAQQRLDEAKDLALLSLRCLVAIGKGLQVPEDLPIILTNEEQMPVESLWKQGEGELAQKRIAEMVHIIVVNLQEDGEVVDAACGVFRTGFAESVPGPFVFPAEVVVDFLLARGYKGVRLETVLSTCSILVSSHSTNGSPEIRKEVVRLLNFVTELVERIQDPQADPEISQGLVEFLNRLLGKYVDVLVEFQPKDRAEKLFMFVLNALAVREPLVKKAASSFWANFVSLNDERPEVQNAVEELVTACGINLAEKLIWALGGGAARSEIDSLAEPLKKLVTRQVRAKSWLSAALAKDGFPSANLSVKDKRIFLEKVMSLRGKRGTNQVVKEFWLNARGSEFG
ncbi:member of the karyopherin-beta, partial [Rhizina undulata]